MISVEEARNIIHEQVFSVSAIKKSLSDIRRNDLLAEDIVTPVDLPLFSNSMMDGYVVADVCETYQIAGEIAAGNTSQIVIENGEAYRIFTGAPVPENSFAVIMQEKASVTGSTVTFLEQPVKYKNIRQKGDQVRKGETVLPTGTLLTPGVIGFLANMGIEQISVYDKPKIAILTTGDECKSPGSKLEYGQIYESNSLMLDSALSENGYTAKQKIHAGDTYEETKRHIEDLLAKNDVLIISGGISVGDHDYVNKCLTDLGVNQLIYKIKQKPGKPFFLGRLADKVVIALPGNPASSLTCLYLYGLPVIKLLSGAPADRIFPAEINMHLAHPHEKKGDRPEFVRSCYHPTGGNVDILTKQRSSMLHSYAIANCLVHLPEGDHKLIEGQTVTGYLL
ncbi:MAG: molybdopterin molybdotransferase MoeA [Cyclobacteriaceae bacterium]